MGADTMGKEQGISASTITELPTKTRTPDKVGSREDDPWLKHSPSSSKPSGREIDRRGFIKWGLMGVGGLVAGEIARRLFFSARAENVAPPFDLSKLDTERQTVVIGQNARLATPEDIQNHIQGPQPKIINSRDIKTIEDYPKISIIPSIGSEAGKIEVWRVPSGTAIVKGGPEFLKISVQNAGTRFGFPTLEGINIDTAEVFLAPGPNNTIVNGKLRFTTMYIKAKNNDRFVIVEMGSSVNKLATTDFTKDPPIVDYMQSKYERVSLEDIIRQENGRKFNIADNPALFATASADCEVNIKIVSGKDQNFSGSSVLPRPKVSDGNLLINPLR